MSATVSVVIPAFNTERFVQDAVRSVIGQEGHPGLDIIVVDDGSSDATAARAEALEPEARRRGHALRVVRQANRGPSGARNAGLARAAGEYVGFLDSDDVWHPGKVARQLALHLGDPGLDITSAGWRVVDEAGRPTGRCGFSPVERPRFADLMLGNLVGQSAVLARREAIVAAGMFDERIGSAEDLDLWIRVACLRDGNILCIGAPLHDSRRRDGQLTWDWRRMRLGWEAAMAKAARLNPGEFARMERRARATAHRYWASLAYAAGDYAEARSLLAEAWRISPRWLAADRRSWPTSLAVAATLLPRGLHRRLDAAARSAWAAQRT